MSQIPSGLSRLKAPSKIVKPIQGGGVGGGVGQPSTSSVRPRGAAASSAQAAVPVAQSRTASSGSKGSHTPSGPVRRGQASPSENGKLSASASRERLVSPRGSLTGGQIAQPRLPSREGSQTRLQYRRESSSSSLKSAGSKTELSQPSAPRRRGEASRSPDVESRSISNLLDLFKTGDRVLVGGTNAGVIAFIGETRFAKGNWAGVVLDKPVGKNDGQVQGVRYFECQRNHGIFTKLEKLTKINRISDDYTRTSASEYIDGTSKPNFQIGDRIVVSGTKTGVLRYLGETGFAKGQWAGVELDEPLGKNDGAVAGTRYFQCQPSYGLFAPLHKIVKSSLPTPARRQSQSSLENDEQNSLAALGSNTSISSLASSQSGSSPTAKPSTVTAQTFSSPEPEASEVKSSTTVSISPSAGVIASQLVALQASDMLKDASVYIIKKKEEALEDREKQIQALLTERELEQKEVASTSIQVIKAEEEFLKLREGHEQALSEKQKHIEKLQRLVEAAQQERTELQLQLEEERRKVEDLQFKLEEEEITLGDELKTEQKEIEALEVELKEKKVLLVKFEKDLENTQAEKETALCKVSELENVVHESERELSSLRSALSDSKDKVKELESSLFLATEEKSSCASVSEQVLRKKSEKIANLERELEESCTRQAEMESELKTTKLELKQSVKENESLHKTIEDLTDKLHSKEDEFDSLCSELQVIKETTLELQKQLHLSELKSESLAADKNKLESEIAELAKNSGDSSQKMVYLNEQLREKDRILDKLKSSSAEAQVQIGRLSEDLAQAKELHSKDLQALKKSHAEQTTTAENIVKSLKQELEQCKNAEEELKNSHQANLQDLKQSKDTELSAIEEQMKQKTERINLLVQELQMAKTCREQILKERDDLKHQHSKLLSDFEASERDLVGVRAHLESLQTEKNLVLGAQGDTEKKYQDLVRKYSALDQEHQQLLKVKEETLKVNEEKKQELDLLQKEKDITVKEKLEVVAELDVMRTKFNALQREVEVAKSEVSTKEEKLKEISSSASDATTQMSALRKEVEEAYAQKEQATKRMTILTEQQYLLQQSVEVLQKEKTALKTGNTQLMESLEKAHEEIRLKNSQLEESKMRENNAKVAAESERETLLTRLRSSEHTVKKREEEVQSYKKEIEVLKNKHAKTVGEPSTSPMRSVADADGLASKLQETEDMLEAVQAEKDSAEAQVDFLNSVIVDLQRKNEEQTKKIELLVTGDVPNTNGVFYDLSDDEPVRPGLKQRLFCDICDVFDLHDTDDCPTQASSGLDDQGTQYHGNRNEERPYCDICEMFGHWTQDCDDEETF